MLPLLKNFTNESLDPARYVRLPPEWFIAVTDVRGSTKLAEGGRSRDVNFAAAAAVASLRQAITKATGGPAACQFTGDGATAAVPPEAEGAVRTVLGRLGAWSREGPGVEQRVGLVPVARLTHPVLAALQEVGGAESFGLFLGEGAAEAEALVKSGHCHVAPEPGTPDGLEHLTCRWEPVPSRRGTVLCVIADATAGGPEGVELLRRVAGEIDAIVDTATVCPLADGSPLKPRWLPSGIALRMELSTAGAGGRAGKLFGSLLAVLVVKLLSVTGRRLGGFDPEAYRRAMAERTDYRKTSGGLRMVIDVSLDEADRIEALLRDLGDRGLLRYGTARTPAATVTCLVGDIAAGRHVHFLDGAGLGYWQASKGYKAWSPRQLEPATPETP